MEPHPAPVTFRDDAQATADWIARYLERVGELPVRAQVEPGDLTARLPSSPPESPEPFAAVLRDLDDVILPAVTHWNHPRFFAYFATSSSEPAILAEFLAAALNTVAIRWQASPASTELEYVTVGWLAQLLGLPASWHGHIEDTASTSTLAALAAARTVRPDARVVVCSEHAHFSVEKAARIVGLETRTTPADDAYRLRPDLLDLTDACAVVATVGTTSSTAVDPVAAIADRAAGAWLHVDAAYAGAAMVCPELRWAFEGVERADSLVVNPHKWLFMPTDISCIWTSRPDVFRETFSLVPAYLRTGAQEDLSLSDYGPALGRRFRSLKLWAVLRCFGRSGLQAVIREHVRLAALFEEWVRAEAGWEVVAPREFSVVCFRRDATDDENAALLERVNAAGDIFISPTELDGRYVLRLAVGNLFTTEADVARAWDVLRGS
ncbi:MAG: pyridoxal phosphate-dependent decarboxylase family protein [Gaiellaceae bacterium]